MPTAESFTALGVGNGFPACPRSYNVEDYSEWITLGGFKKGDSGSPTAQQIMDSRNNAMHLFWNLYDVTGSLTSQTGSGTTLNLSRMTDGSFNYTPFNGGEPRTRACYGWNAGRITCLGRGTDDGTSTTLKFEAGYEIFRMMQGGEFIGYGFSETRFAANIAWFGAPFGAGGYANTSDAYIALGSLVYGVPTDMEYFKDDYDYLGNLVQTSQYDTAYVNIGGMPFVCTAISRSAGFEVASRATFTVNAAAMSAAVSYDWPQPGRLNSTVNASVQGLEFYAYI